MTSVSELLTLIKMDLGIYSLKLPFENGDQALLDVIKMKSLKTFSIYCPHVSVHTFQLEKLKKIKSSFEESCFLIPHIFDGRDILYIRNVRTKCNTLNTYYTPSITGTVESYQDMMLGNAYMDLYSTITPPFTFKFISPNKLYLYNLITSSGEIEVEVALEHADNLSTITPTSWDSFYDLAVLDIKKFLYNTMKHYTEIQSAYGTISLKIDDWSNAESDRNDLINKWREVYHLDGEQLYKI